MPSLSCWLSIATTALGVEILHFVGYAGLRLRMTSEQGCSTPTRLGHQLESLGRGIASSKRALSSWRNWRGLPDGLARNQQKGFLPWVDVPHNLAIEEGILFEAEADPLVVPFGHVHLGV